mmetsp:Transcript_14893/g.37756  ORF Transcript_14893/g.37756 Transcript_14893/m.37756 type:complete len:221 (-) Transcript_14893:82-744(-)
MDDASGVLEHIVRVDAAANRSPGRNLLLHRDLAPNEAVFGDGRVRIPREGGAGAAVFGMIVARPRDVDRRARPIGELADASGGVRRASHVRLRGLVADPRARGDRELVEPLVGRESVATIARTQKFAPAIDAIQQVLNREFDLHALSSPPQDLDAVLERRDRGKGPAGAAVLREVLLPHTRAVAVVVQAVDVAPVEGRRIGCCREAVVGGIAAAVACHAE